MRLLDGLSFRLLMFVTKDKRRRILKKVAIPRAGVSDDPTKLGKISRRNTFETTRDVICKACGAKAS